LPQRPEWRNGVGLNMASEYEEITIDDSEFEQMARMLEEFPQKVQEQMLLNATGAGATVLQLAVIERAPERVDQRTAGSTSLPAGYVKADVRVQKLKSEVVQGWLIGPSAITVHVWRWLEFGHLVRLAKKFRGKQAAKVEHVPARPFVRPAFDEYWRTAYDVTVRRLGELIADYWRQGWEKVA
jgi:hypothetical protein